MSLISTLVGETWLFVRVVKTLTFQLLPYYLQRGLQVSIHLLCAIYAQVFFRAKKNKLPPIKGRLLLSSGVVLSKKIRAGQIKAENVLKEYIKRVTHVQPMVNAVIQNRFDLALEEAKETDKWVAHELAGNSPPEGRRSIHDQPLLGLPFTCKDSIGIEGMYLTSGLYLRKGIRSREDSAVVHLLREAGGIPLALTNVPELCQFWDTDNLIYGRTNNPYDLSRIPGGSSGGEGALIASAGSLMGVGSDIGGSIRIPSFSCGVFGHKTTPGIVSLEGIYPPTPESKKKYNSLGPMCRYACDLKPMLKVMAGENVSKLKLDDPVDISTLRVFYMDEADSSLVTPVDPQIKVAIERAANYLATKCGAIETNSISLDKLRSAPYIAFATFSRAEGAISMASEMRLRQGEVNLPLELVKWLFRLSNHTISAIVFAIAEKLMPKPSSSWSTYYYDMGQELKLELESLLGDNGVLLFPTHPEPAPKHKTTLFKTLNIGYTWVMNVMGVPSTHCPLGLATDGLPIGCQVIASPFNDHLTLAVAQELEKGFGGWVRPPSYSTRIMSE